MWVQYICDCNNDDSVVNITQQHIKKVRVKNKYAICFGFTGRRNTMSFASESERDTKYIEIINNACLDINKEKVWNVATSTFL